MYTATPSTTNVEVGTTLCVCVVSRVVCVCRRGETALAVRCGGLTCGADGIDGCEIDVCCLPCAVQQTGLPYRRGSHGTAGKRGGRGVVALAPSCGEDAHLTC
jgi:hypothetical protein